MSQFWNLIFLQSRIQMNETYATWTAVVYSFIWLPLSSTTSARTNATVSYWEDGIDGLDARDPKTWHYILGPKIPRPDTMQLFLMGICKRTCLCSTITRWLEWVHKQNHGYIEVCDRRHSQTRLGRIQLSRWCCPCSR